MLMAPRATFPTGKTMDEILINAKITALVEQRNNALNQCVNLMGDLAVAQARIQALEAQLKEQEEAEKS